MILNFESDICMILFVGCVLFIFVVVMCFTVVVSVCVLLLLFFKHVFQLNCYANFDTLQNSLICLDLSLGSMLEDSVLKNAVECAGQRLKRTSGAQVMTFLL